MAIPVTTGLGDDGDAARDDNHYGDDSLGYEVASTIAIAMPMTMVFTLLLVLVVMLLSNLIVVLAW